LFKNFAYTHNIELKFSPAGQHQWTGQVEKLCGTIRSHLTKAVDNNWSTWDVYLPSILFGLRFRPSSATNRSPFYLLYGLEPRVSLSFDNVTQAFPITRQQELDPLPLSRELLTKLAKPTSIIPSFTPGSLVLVTRYPTRSSTIKNKQLTPFIGPFRIIKVLLHNMYEMVNEHGKLKKFHVSRLVSYYLRAADPSSSLEGGNVNVIY
jgi:hypothetical protein